MSLIVLLLRLVLRLFVLSLFGRLILDYARVFAPQWRPKGILLAIAEVVYAITDPVITFVRRFIPPLRLGPVAIDLSFILIFIVVQMLSNFVARL
ncbi:MAG: YggT family protein [Actinomycetes bacterium]